MLSASKRSSTLFLNRRSLCLLERSTVRKKCSPRSGRTSRSLATYTEPSHDTEISNETSDMSTSFHEYTSRYVVSVVPPLPVLDKLTQIQAKIASSTRMTPVKRTDMYIRLVPLGTSIENDIQLASAKRIIDNIARETKPIEVEVAGLGCLPKWSKPREVWAGIAAGKEQLKYLIRQLETAFQEAQFALNEPGAVKHRTRIPLGTWEDVYVTSVQGDLAKQVADSVGNYTQASFLANQMVLLEQKPDGTVLPLHIAFFGTTLPAKKRARYKSQL